MPRKWILNVRSLEIRSLEGEAKWCSWELVDFETGARVAIWNVFSREEIDLLKVNEHDWSTELRFLY